MTDTIKQAAKKFNEVNGRAMTYSDSLVLSSIEHGFPGWEHVYGPDELLVSETAAELYAGCCRTNT